MAAEAVEALDADEAPEPAAALLEEPKQAKRVANGDGIRWPLGFAFRAASDEAEIDERGLGAIEMADTELADGSNPAALALAASIKTSQTAEISEMQQLLQTL